MKNITTIAQHAPNNPAFQFKEMELQDRPSLFQSQEKPLAELLRPAQEIKEKIKAETRKPQGAKSMKVARPVQYVNWFSPLSWSQIETMA